MTGRAATRAPAARSRTRARGRDNGEDRPHRAVAAGAPTGQPDPARARGRTRAGAPEAETGAAGTSAGQSRRPRSRGQRGSARSAGNGNGARRAGISGAAPPVLHPGEIFCPVGRALDLIGDRWLLVLVRHLLLGPKGFQELRKRSGIAPRVLSARLRQMMEAGFVEALRDRSGYALTERGRTLEPIVAAVARWWVHHAMEDHIAIRGRFTETSPQSILESLPFLLREERARGADVCFEIRLTGEGGGVWTVAIREGECHVESGFAEKADIRYTADARIWCGVALGRIDARDAVKRGLMTKEGGHTSIAHYFYQFGSPPRGGRTETPARKQRRKP